MLYSQRDPAYKDTLLPLSNLTIGNDGCLLCSMATLGQVSPVNLLNTVGGFVQGGLVVPDTLAKVMGMFYVGSTTVPPKGWCIGRTDAYASKGYPTHFLCVNVDTNQMVDPLHYPSGVETLTYHINQYRVFAGIKFSLPVPPPVFEVSQDAQIPSWASSVVAKANAAGITTPLTDNAGSIPLYQLLLLLDKYFSK